MGFFNRHKASASASTEPPKEQYGLFPLNEVPNADLDIVAVHGLGGHYKETWTDNDSQKLWLRDFLPSQLEDIGITARIMSYGYESTTAFSKSVTDIEDQATILVDALNSERRSPSEENRPLMFIAHSLGGIIVKKAMIIAHERRKIYGMVLDSVRAVVFFGVPHRGSDLAYWSTFAARLLNTVQLGLGTNTSFVEALNRNSKAFADISQSFIERAEHLKIRTFYEMGRLSGKVIVDKDSARLGLPNEIAVGVIDADHGTICKFKDKGSQRYRPIWKAIQLLCVKAEEGTAPTRTQPKSFFIVPFSRDPLFLGREDVIDLVDTKFESKRRVALTGIGGVGKSQIAIEYCYRFKDRHADSNILWIHASTKQRFEQAIKAIARNCKLPGWDNPARNPLDLVYDWLNGHSTWLMVLDNADDKDVFFDKQPTIASQSPQSQRCDWPFVMYLPQASGVGSMLITSRNKDAAFRLTDSVENLIEVPHMEKEDAIALLCKKLPHDHSSDDQRLELIELLESLPLAITQAASYISVKRTRMTIAKYSDFLRKNGDVLLDDMGDLRRDPTIRNSVLLTWHISFDKINGENPPAAELLSLMSLFDRQGIPQDVLRGKDEEDPYFERCLAPLEEFSLVTVEDGGRSFQMHRLVQIAIREWLVRHGGIERWKQKAAKLIANSLPIGTYQFWKIWETLLPHSEIALTYILPDKDSRLIHAKILYYTAQYLRSRGKYNVAKERCQRALDVRLDLLGGDDIEVADSLLLLAMIMNDLYENEESEAICRRGIDIFERVQGKDDVWLSDARNVLGAIIISTSDDRKIEEATEILRSNLAYNEQTLGLEHPATISTTNNLAAAFLKQHKYSDSEELYRKLFEIELKVFGADNPTTLTNMHNLAWTLFRQEKYEGVEELAQCVLDWRTRVLGEDHPDTLCEMRFLSHIFLHRGKTREAEELCRYALALHKTVHGDSSIYTMDCTNIFADVLVEQQKYGQAEELFR